MKSFRLRTFVCAGLVLCGLLSALPNALTPQIADMLPRWYTQNTVTLGLDLRGGSHLLLEVDTSKLARDEAVRFVERVETELARERIHHRGAAAGASGATITVSSRDDLARAASIARTMAAELDRPVPFAVGVDGTTLTVTPTASFANLLAAGAVERSLEIVRQRLDATGVVEPSVTRQGADGIVVQLPGVDNPARIRELLGTTAQLNFHLVSDYGTPAATMTLPGSGPGERYDIDRRPALEGTHVSDARLGFSQHTNEPVVQFKLDRDGATQFASVTKDNIGRALAIVLDDRVISAPVIRSAIPGGAGEITGAFTVAQASDLALLLRAGALPAPLHVIEERTVGPDLGSDAIRMGLTTGLLGALAVIGCMFALYGRWAFIANTALLINVALIFGTLSLLGATLTLPGIAGIVLSIGMAVDANILINERIREELRRGSKPFAALDAGFRRAFATILDSSVTTLIATSLLFMFGSGPVRGFAVTIAIGLMTSMFTALTVTRLLMEWHIRRRRRAPLTIGGDRLAHWLGHRDLSFMRARYAGLTASAVLSIAALTLVFAPGLNRGVDFNGGTLIEARTASHVTVEALRDTLAQHGLADVSIQQFGDAGDFLIRAPLRTGHETDANVRVAQEIKDAVHALTPEASFPRTEMVGPRVSEAFVATSLLTIVLASIGMLGYLWLRFEWPFAVGAIATLGLDLTKALGFFALFGIEFNLTAIAALLALIGYSVNDKVVIFDRIRETLRADVGTPSRAAFDSSISSTLPRTIFTSLTTFVAIVPMAIAGGSAVSSFAWPMLFAIVVGTSSSIFIASPIALILAQRFFRHRPLFAPSDITEAVDEFRAGARRPRVAS